MYSWCLHLAIFASISQLVATLHVFHLHVPKTGGTFLRHWISQHGPELNLKACPESLVCCGSGRNLQQSITRMQSGICNFVSDEWKYTTLKRFNVSSRQIITMVRLPLLHLKSQFEHDIRHDRYPTPDSKLFDHVAMGYEIDNPQSSRLLSTVPMSYTAIETSLRRFLAVGITDYPLHTVCILMHKLNAPNFKRCNCGNHLPKRNNNNIVTMYTTKTLNAMHNNTHLDNILYLAAFNIFIESVRDLDESRGTSLSSCL